MEMDDILEIMPKVVNIVVNGDIVLVTIRYPETDEEYGHDRIFAGKMEDVYWAEFPDEEE